MINPDDVKRVHHGKNVKRFRNMRGIKQGTLADTLGVSQQALSLIEQKEIIDNAQMEEIAKALNVPMETLQEFDDESSVFNIQNNYEGSNKQENNSNCTMNPIDKVVELYERLLKEKDAQIAKLSNDKK
jgi:transcriptional regulator with XRE-family HTH domain